VTGARRALGDVGENLAARRYAADGYDILDRNWRCADGELDLVVARGGVVVFCEVKTRRSDRFGLPVEAVTVRKQHRLRTLAGRWLDANRSRRGGAIRFDVASVVPDGHGGWIVTVLEQAF
jgi:putative endonuclease